MQGGIGADQAPADLLLSEAVQLAQQRGPLVVQAGFQRGFLGGDVRRVGSLQRRGKSHFGHGHGCTVAKTSELLSHRFASHTTAGMVNADRGDGTVRLIKDSATSEVCKTVLFN